MEDNQNYIKHIDIISDPDTGRLTALSICFGLIFGIMLTSFIQMIGMIEGKERLSNETVYSTIIIFPIIFQLFMMIGVHVHSKITKLDTYDLKACQAYPWNEKGKEALNNVLKDNTQLSLWQLEKVYKENMKENIRLNQIKRKQEYQSTMQQLKTKMK